ncbi:ABC transporter substrate-binding protein [Gemmobacter serpentinus]|uniref:ABC transporter substrate-binding protein n=1 Tax=Gemmobacter serpentinus TaxID=2652247 RepID=UPI00124F10E5|nr:ABC transporter substrate-binding protein [Gemmobacter serpentinus]
MSSATRLTAHILPFALALWPGLALAEPLKVQLNADIRSNQPGVNRDAGSDSVMMNVVEGLVTQGDGGRIVPALAESWTVSEDGTRYAFTLRDGVTFHNGEPLTADAVKWSLEKMLGDENFPCRNFFDGSRGAKITEIAAPDARTVTLTLETPNALLLPLMAQTQCGGMGIVAQASYNADGSWKSPIGTGPFAFGAWKRGESIQLIKYAGYVPHGDAPDGFGGRKEALVDEVNFLVVPDISTAIAGLESGALDILPYISPTEGAKLRDEKGLAITAEPHGGIVTMLFQTDDPLMSNLALRKAFVAALDMPGLVDAIMGGLTTPNNSLVASKSSYHGDVQKQGYSYDPAAVPALLAEAGYKGEKITILTNRRSAINFDTAMIAQAMLQAVGINAEIEVLDWATQLDRFNSGNYQVMAFNYSNRADPALAFQAVTGSKAENANAIWDNDEVTALVAQVTAEADPAKRQALFDTLHQRFLAELPLVMLTNSLDVSAARPGIEGYRTLQGIVRLWGVSRS